MNKKAFHSDLMRRENALKILADASFVKWMRQQTSINLRLDFCGNQKKCRTYSAKFSFGGKSAVRRNLIYISIDW